MLSSSAPARAEQRERLVVFAETGQDPAEDTGRDRALAGGAGPQGAERSLDVAARRRQGEGLAREVPGPDQVAAALGLASPDHGVAKQERVHLVRAEPEPVAVVGAAHHLGAGLGPGAGDHDLERLGRVGRDVVLPPDLVDQPLLAQGAPARDDQGGQQRVGPPAGHRRAVPGHLVEEAEIRGHETKMSGRRQCRTATRGHQHPPRATAPR